MRVFVKGVPYWFCSKIMSKAYDEGGGQDECQKFARYNCRELGSVDYTDT